MEIESFFGVPAHPLFVHLPVVLTPLALSVAIALSFRSRWRRSFAWVTAFLAGVSLFGAQLAVASGEPLEESVQESEALEMHTELGESARTLIAVFFILAVVLVVYEFWRRRRASSDRSKWSSDRIAAGLLALTVVMGGLATVWVVRAGHQGAEVTWVDVTLEGD